MTIGQEIKTVKMPTLLLHTAITLQIGLLLLLDTSASQVLLAKTDHSLSLPAYNGLYSQNAVIYIVSVCPMYSDVL